MKYLYRNSIIPQNNMNEPIFTRYLYFKAEVINSLHWSILDKQLDESLYWAYEMYFSGFKQEVFDFSLQFCKMYNNEIYPHYYIHIQNFNKEWISKKDDCVIGTIIKLLVNSKFSITNLLRINQGIQNNMESNICIPDFDSQRLSEKELHKYKTIKLTKKMHNWSFLNNIACKYYVRRVMCCELSLLYPTVESINFDEWMYHASKTPIWKQRIVNFNGIIDNKQKGVIVDDDDFYEQYDYEPDEQSSDLKDMLWGNDIRKYENMSGDEFCKKYSFDNKYQKHNINIRSKSSK